MKTLHWYAAALAIALLVTTGACTTGVWTQGHSQFDDHDRQVTRDWYSQHQNNSPEGLRPQDRLTPDQESRLVPGRPFDGDLRQQAHSVPSDLRHQLPPPPRGHEYVAVGGHVALVDTAHHTVKDVIHLHDENHH